MQSTAFVVGPMDGAGSAIMQLSQEVGFDDVLHYEGPDQAAMKARRTPVCFFLVSSATKRSVISEFVTEIRHHKDRPLRFSPILFLCEDPSPRIINFCVQAGFDDIVAPPFTAPRLLDRVMNQLKQPSAYYETETYFGPDRRRMERGKSPFASMRVGDDNYRQFAVRRDLRLGISVTAKRSPPKMPNPAYLEPSLQSDDLLVID